MLQLFDARDVPVTVMIASATEPMRTIQNLGNDNTTCSVPRTPTSEIT
jgi:hypothetical protein